MVLITPRLVRPLDPDEVPPLPTSIRPVHQERAISVSSSKAAAEWSMRRPERRGQDGATPRTAENSHDCSHTVNRTRDATSAARCSFRWPLRCWPCLR